MQGQYILQSYDIYEKQHWYCVIFCVHLYMINITDYSSSIVDWW